MNPFYDPAPRRPTTKGERWGIAASALVLLGLVFAELAAGGDPRKLSAVFVVLFWYPLIVIHELGHALCARFLGFTVHEIVLGFGPELARFRWLGARVIVRLMPAGGYVIPTPDRTAGARSRSALIYLAGPAAEIAAAGITIGLIGAETFFQRSADLSLLAAQSFVLAAVMGAVTNLLPTSAAGSASDGLGMWLSLWAGDEHFAFQMAHPHLRKAEERLAKGRAELALQGIDDALRREPHDPYLLAMRARCLAQCGQADAALDLLQTLRQQGTYSDLAEAERLHAAAAVALSSGDRALWIEAETACRAALQRVPGAPEYLLTHAALLLEHNRFQEAYAQLLHAYKHTRDPLLEDQCLRLLARSAAGLGLDAEEQRYRAALSGRS